MGAADEGRLMPREASTEQDDPHSLHRSSLDSTASDTESPHVNFRASLVSFPPPPSFLPQAGPSRQSLVSISDQGHHDAHTSDGHGSRRGSADRSVSAREHSLRSLTSRQGGSGPSARSSQMPMHRSRVSLDATQLPLQPINTSLTYASNGSSARSTGSITPTSTRSRTSSINRSHRSRPIRDETGFVPPLNIPPRKQSRMSMPAMSPINAAAGPSEIRYHSAVTPDFEHMNPLERHIAMMATPASHRRQASLGVDSMRSYASSSRSISDTQARNPNERSVSFAPASRPISPTFSDASDSEFVVRPPDANAMPSLTDATLRMTPGVIGIGEGWGGGPQPKQSRRWWRRGRSKVEEDPLALWTVTEESPDRKRSPLKNAWNRSLVAIGLSGNAVSPQRERRASDSGSPGLKTRTYQRAKGLFSRSRVNLSETRERTRPDLQTVDEGDEGPTSSRATFWLRTRRRPGGLYSRSQDDLARFPAPPPRDAKPASLQPATSEPPQATIYRKRYAASQPHLPAPRSSSLSNDPFIVPTPAAQLWQPSERNRAVPAAIIEEEESQLAYTPPVRSSRIFRMKRTSTFGNGADDITTELGFNNNEDESRASDVSSLDFAHHCPVQPVTSPKDRTSKRQSMLGRPLIGRLATGFSSLRSLSRTSMASPITSERKRETSAPSVDGTSLVVTVDPQSTQSSSPASSSLRTPVPEPVSMIPLAPEAPMPDISPVAPPEVVRAPTWKQRSITASRSVLSLGLPIGHERPGEGRRLSLVKRLKPKSLPQARRQSSAVDVSGRDDKWCVEENVDEGMQERRQTWRRSIGSGIPPLKRASLSDFSLLRFSFRSGSEDTFAGLFDVGRTPSRSRDEPVFEPVLPVPDGDNEQAQGDAVLQDTLRQLEGRVEVLVDSPTESPGVDNDNDRQEEPSDQYLAIRPSAKRSSQRSSVPAASTEMIRGGFPRLAQDMPRTPIRPSASPTKPFKTPQSTESARSHQSATSALTQDSLRTLRPDADTPSAKRESRALEESREPADEPRVARTPTGTAPPAPFAWASRPGMAQRASSASSYHTASGFLASSFKERIQEEAAVSGHDRRPSLADTIDSVESCNQDVIDTAIIQIKQAKSLSGMMRQGSLVAVQDLALSGRTSLETV